MERQTKKVLICGDSYSQDDPAYPGLHFSQKIANSFPVVDWKICNLGIPGASNRLIAEQLSQGMMYNPDFVILLFTTSYRNESSVDNPPLKAPRSLNPEDIQHWNKTRYDCGGTGFVRTSKGKMLDSIDPVTDIQNIINAAYCLEFLKRKNIPYCWMEGPLTKVDYAGNYMTDPFSDHMDTRIPLNLWDYNNTDFPGSFHVDNEEIQESFANMCLNHILDRLDV